MEKLMESFEIIKRAGEAYAGRWADHVAIQNALVEIKKLIDSVATKKEPQP